MRMKNTSLLIVLYLIVQPLSLAAQGFAGGFAQGMNEAMQDRRERDFQRELLERQLQHERDMLSQRQATAESETSNSRSFRVLPEIDFYGADITQNGVRGITLDTCIQICIDNGSCAAVSWVPAQSWCFPKGRGYTKQLNENVVSVEIR
jgi:hypothetical protein